MNLNRLNRLSSSGRDDNKKIQQLWDNKKSGHDFQIMSSICEYDLTKTEDGKYHLIDIGGNIALLSNVVDKDQSEIEKSLSDISDKTPNPEVALAQRTAASEWSSAITQEIEYDYPKQIEGKHEVAYFNHEQRLMTAIVIDQMREINLETGQTESHEIDVPQNGELQTEAQQEIWQKSIAQRQDFDMTTYPYNQEMQEMGTPVPSPLEIADHAVEIDENTLRGRQENIRNSLSSIRHDLHEDLSMTDAADVIRRNLAERAERSKSKDLEQEPDHDPER